MAVLLIARFSGDVAELTRAYDGAHAMIMAVGGAKQFGDLHRTNRFSAVRLARCAFLASADLSAGLPHMHAEMRTLRARMHMR